MKIRELVDAWQKAGSEPLTDETYAVHLPLYDAAKVEALGDLFPGLTRERILTDLVASALDELTSSLSYQPGEAVAGYDEMGDPMYVDAGLTPRFQQLTHDYATKMAPKSDS